MPGRRFKICSRDKEKLRDYASDLELYCVEDSASSLQLGRYARRIGAREAAAKLRAMGMLLERCVQLAIAVQEEKFERPARHPSRTPAYLPPRSRYPVSPDPMTDSLRRDIDQAWTEYRLLVACGDGDEMTE